MNHTIRPRLTRRQVLFIIEALKTYEQVQHGYAIQRDRLEWNVYELKRKFMFDVFRYHTELSYQKERLAAEKPVNYAGKATIAQGLARRLESLVQGGRLHTDRVTEAYLEDIVKEINWNQKPT